MTDTWVPRTAVEYAQAIESELPQGTAWPRDPSGDLMRWVAGCAAVWGDFDVRAAALLKVESDPRLTIEMLSDWETAFGLPDPCSAEVATIETRRSALINRLTIQGSQSIAFFVNLAATFGYPISIYEYAPYTCGISRCGETRPDGTLVINYARCGAAQCGIDRQGLAVMTGGSAWYWQVGAPEIRYYWKVKVANPRLTWLRCGTGESGKDHLCEIGLATDLECAIRRWAPAHTDVIFDYSGLNAVVSDETNFSFVPAL